MALEVFCEQLEKQGNKIQGFEVVVMDKLREQYPDKFNESGQMDYKWFESEIRPNKFIYVRQDVGSVSFTVQNGPIKEVGVNGCQMTAMIEAALLMIKGFSEKFPCRENAITITKIEEALMWQEKITKDRVKKKEGLRGLIRHEQHI